MILGEPYGCFAYAVAQKLTRCPQSKPKRLRAHDLEGNEVALTGGHYSY